MVFIVCNIEMD